MLGKIKETATFIKETARFQPEIAIILGTGLGGIIDNINICKSIDYSEIPGFPVSTAPGHTGRLIFGTFAGKNVMAMQGRFHYYEGYTMQEITFPVRVMKFLGIKNLFLSNASGGINPEFEIGDLMVQTDHINLIPNPLIGKHYPEFGERFPDMSQCYNKDLIRTAIKIAGEHQIKVQQGCYVGVTGPSLETPGEYEYFRSIGGDAVGMSTTPEVIVAHQMGIHCFAISVISNLGIPGKIIKVGLDDVQKAAARSAPRVTIIMENLIENL